MKVMTKLFVRWLKDIGMWYTWKYNFTRCKKAKIESCQLRKKIMPHVFLNSCECAGSYIDWSFIWGKTNVGGMVWMGLDECWSKFCRHKVNYEKLVGESMEYVKSYGKKIR